MYVIFIGIYIWVILNHCLLHFTRIPLSTLCSTDKYNVATVRMFIKKVTRKEFIADNILLSNQASRCKK